MEDELYLFKNYLIDEEDSVMEDSFLDDEFLKPSNILMEEECDDYFPEKKEEKNIFKDTFGIKEVKTKELEKNEVDLFTFPKLIYGDKVLDDSDEDKEEDNYLFKPVDLIYEDHLELFNKRREQGIVIGSSKKQSNKNEEKTGVGKPKTFLGCLRAEIRAKVFDKKD
jgi:hypothetical protein